MRNPANVRTARRLLRATRAVERARKAVNAPAASKPSKRSKRSKRLSPIEKVRAIPGFEDFPEEGIEDFIAPDGSLRTPRGYPADMAGPILRALGAPQRQAKRRGSTGEDPSGREFRAKMLEATRSRADLRRMGVENPPADIRRALALFKRWSGREAAGVSRVTVPKGTPRALVKLGELTDIGYRSDKWGGKHHRYIHATNRPRPILCASADGRQLVILGGNVRVRAEGLVG